MACGILPAADTVPVSRVDPFTDILQGTKVTDSYRWLEDQDSPQTRAWIDSQNQYTQAYLARIDGREKLRQRLEALRRYDTRSIPVARAGRYFYSRRLKNENRSSICVRTGLNGQDEILVNPG
jgi:prolyl oligopeptidase